ncbi:MAG: (2Fe-2S) ferredoxin domain-containing protein [Deltaproteobacteria bacterium]|jgi:(2Fe-2S) ferredoxin|nr:(2Fe-2S) ferredoxin domain-containing protein [Deltaproteobacteria bacterium]
MIKAKHHVLICGGGKLVGDKKGTCNSRDSQGLVKKLMRELEDRDLDSETIVSVTTCFGICDKGPIMVIYPEGKWYSEITSEKLVDIIDEELEADG